MGPSRSQALIASVLDTFRAGKSSELLRDAVAELAMRLVDADDRRDFAKADGPTSIFDHVRRLQEEQAMVQQKWTESSLSGHWMDEFEVRDLLQFLLIALCHMCLDKRIAATLHAMHAAPALFALNESIRAHVPEFQPFVLEVLRNLAFVPSDAVQFPALAIQDLWDVLLGDHHELELRVLAADILCNLSFHSPALLNFSEPLLSTLLDGLLGPSDPLLRAAMADVLCNIACDADACLYLVCDLDDRKPPHFRHSGVVYLGTQAEAATDRGLQTSMEALTHNLAWGDATGKRNRLSVRFALPLTPPPQMHQSPPPAPLRETAPSTKLSEKPASPQARLGGTVRATAMATRRARQVRQKRAMITPVLQPNGVAAQRNLHQKKNLKLHLNLGDCVPKENPALVVTKIGSSKQLQATAAKADSELQEEELLSPPMRRRVSSLTLGLDSHEGADFKEVANDGPAELGKRTKRVKRLGKGAGGTVCLSLYLPNLKLVAVKEVVVYKKKKDEREMVKHELHALHDNLACIDEDESLDNMGGGQGKGVLQELRHHFPNIGKPQHQQHAHPYLVSFYGAYLKPTKNTISIVMEFMDMGSVQNLLDDHVTVSENVLRHCAFCCMTALEHMHSMRMIHRDIKPANILMNRKGDFKIADFGLAGTLSKSASFFSEFEGTVMYMAPERIQGKNYKYVSDVWSMGIVLFSLATGAYPFAVEDGFFGLEDAIVSEPLPPMPNSFSPECRDFVKGLLRRDPSSRLTSTQALAHPFLRGYQGSAEHRAFPGVWHKMPIKSSIQPEDVRVISALIAEHSPGRLSTANADPHGAGGSEPHGLFSRFGHHSSHDRDGNAHDRNLQHLADDCGVTLHYLTESLANAPFTGVVGV
ncbi:TPA: hypothetical protein N0F65_003270 [Lagenidium giganteum]|uniref:mitogen-activated protein kinase kinase n=1 Tax=Lagenidium giganteum TaxID=4803 RepID=A0AAV2YJV0_9STRA|nr:TPA: hypothetical protein N0F65_003270 [Lagenidium giganteum]